MCVKEMCVDERQGNQKLTTTMPRMREKDKQPSRSTHGTHDMATLLQVD